MGKLLLWPLYFGGLRLRLVYDYGKTMGVHVTFYPTVASFIVGSYPYVLASGPNLATSCMASLYTCLSVSDHYIRLSDEDVQREVQKIWS